MKNKEVLIITIICLWFFGGLSLVYFFNIDQKRIMQFFFLITAIPVIIKFTNQKFEDWLEKPFKLKK